MSDDFSLVFSLRVHRNGGIVVHHLIMVNVT